MDTRTVSALAPLRPFLLIGVFAFFVGFTGYLAVSFTQGPAGRSFAAQTPTAEVTPARLSPPRAPWTFEKAI